MTKSRANECAKIAWLCGLQNARAEQITSLDGKQKWWVCRTDRKFEDIETFDPFTRDFDAMMVLAKLELSVYPTFSVMHGTVWKCGVPGRPDDFKEGKTTRAAICACALAIAEAREGKR